MLSVPNINFMPLDIGSEVAFIGRSNAGKSSALNVLTNQKNLARTSKKPGRTELINLFEIVQGKRLVDLPGYGYAKLAKDVKFNCQRFLTEYLHKRQTLKGIVLLMDIRNPLKNIDQQIIQRAVFCNIPILILLTKADKLSTELQKIQRNIVHRNVFKFMHSNNLDIQIEIFSSFKRLGIEKLRQKLDFWFINTVY